LRVKIGGVEKSGDAEEQRFGVFPSASQKSQGQTLGQQCERQTVLFVTERLGDGLE
jgi:hypothetical protein